MQRAAQRGEGLGLALVLVGGVIFVALLLSVFRARYLPPGALSEGGAATLSPLEWVHAAVDDVCPFVLVTAEWELPGIKAVSRRFGDALAKGRKVLVF